MPHVIALVIITLLGAALPPTLTAQADSLAPRLAPGTRVRVSSVARQRPLTGLVLASTRDSLLVRAEGTDDTASFAVARLSRLEVSAGSHTQRKLGAKIGLASGMLLGAIVGFASYRDPHCQGEGFCIDFGPGFDAMAGAVTFGAAGTLVGFLVGTRSFERWVTVSGDSALPMQLGVGPARDGHHRVGLSASLRF